MFVTSTNLERTIDLSTTDTSLTVVGLASGIQYFVSVLSTGLENQQSDLTEAVEDRTSKLLGLLMFGILSFEEVRAR